MKVKVLTGATDVLELNVLDGAAERLDHEPGGDVRVAEAEVLYGK
jgi:hypothetical protein